MPDFFKLLLHSDLAKYIVALAVGSIGSVYAIKSDLRSLQEGQASVAKTVETAIHNQEGRDKIQDERVSQLARDMSDSNRELRADIKELRADIRQQKR